MIAFEGMNTVQADDSCNMKWRILTMSLLTLQVPCKYVAESSKLFGLQHLLNSTHSTNYSNDLLNAGSSMDAFHNLLFWGGEDPQWQNNETHLNAARHLNSWWSDQLNSAGRVAQETW